jgi:hypothetical protein
MDKRIDRIEKRLGGEPRHQVAICVQWEWPAEAWAEFVAAGDAGDRERVADLAEQFSGVRPTFSTGLTPVVMIIDHEPEPINPVHAIAGAQRILGAGSAR